MPAVCKASTVISNDYLLAFLRHAASCMSDLVTACIYRSACHQCICEAKNFSAIMCCNTSQTDTSRHSSAQAISTKRKVLKTPVDLCSNQQKPAITAFGCTLCQSA
ncbi:TPA: hypothetical protein ACH3X3_007958 [Trebouxia sp. C0006]